MGLLTLLFGFCVARAEMVTYPAQKITARGITQVRIAGVKGRLRMTGKKTAYYRIRVKHSKGKKFEDWNLSVDRVHDALVLEVFNVALGAQWRKLVRQELWPEFDVEIEGPAKPLVLSWREGDLSFSQWRGDIDATFLSGKFRAVNGRGSLKLQTGETMIDIDDQGGAVDIKGDRGDLDVRRIGGDFRLDWAHGKLSLQKVTGAIEITMPGGVGDVKNIKAKTKIRGEHSEWRLDAEAPAEIEARTDSGPIRLDWTSGGAKIFLTTATGEITVPKRLLIEQREGVKVVEATWGEKPLGQIFLRTESGPVTWSEPIRK